MIAQALQRGVPARNLRWAAAAAASGVTRSLQLSSVIQIPSSRKLCFKKLEALWRRLVRPSVDLVLGGSAAVQNVSQFRSKQLRRLVKGNWPEGWSHSTCSAAPFAFPAVQKHAVSCCSARHWLGGPTSGRPVHGVTCASFSPGVASTEEGQILQAEVVSPPESSVTPYRKRKVALWIGYVGTAFSGLQIMRGPGAVNTIENELERAIYRAGGILDTNYGHLDKLSWSRSSRTDKGVHSLSTVIAMKMEIPSSAWVNDPDGLLLADSINVHLPSTIKVFGIVPVTKSFDARRFCCSRTYQYLLPAALIGISRDSSPEKTSQIIDNFRSVLNKFQGRFAFHNYTIRRKYRTDVKSKRSWSKNSRRRGASFPIKTQAVEDKFDMDELHDDADVQEGLTCHNSKVSPMKAKKSEHIMAYWLDVPDLGDKISAAHFRRILECSCGTVENYNGAQFIRISITGESFMVHQIRKMVATAAAVSNGVLPLQIIPLSLCRHARIVLPLAPSEGLLLAKNSFYPFRQLVAPASEREFRESDVGIARLKELPKLQLTRQMSSKADMFWHDVLLPELAPQIDASLPVWTEWVENLSQATISEEEIREVQASFTNWQELSRLKFDIEEQGQVTDTGDGL